MSPEQHLEQAYLQLDEVAKAVLAIPTETDDPDADIAVAKLRLKLATMQRDLLRMKKSLPGLLKSVAPR